MPGFWAGRDGRSGAIPALALVMWLASAPAHAEVVEVRFGAPEPYAQGRSFGAVGSYLRIKGVARGELDPAAFRNQVIVNLDKAPRNARGMVEYEADIEILTP